MMMMTVRVRRIVVIPPSTDRTIVFPYNWAAKEFRTSHYSPSMTPGNVPTEEINQFLADIEEELKAYHKAAGFAIMRLLRMLGFLLFLAFVIVIVVSIVKLNSSNGSSGFPTGIPIVFVAFFGYVVMMAFLTCVFGARGRSKLVEVTKNVELYIAEREAVFKQRGLYWVVPSMFPYWIELWKDDAVQPINYNPAAFQPLMNQPMQMYPAVGNNVAYTRPGQSAEMMQMQNMYTQMQPMQVQVQQQGYYMQQPQYAGNTYNNSARYA